MSWCVRLCLNDQARAKAAASHHTHPRTTCKTLSSVSNHTPALSPVQVVAFGNHFAALIACNGPSAACPVTSSPRMQTLFVRTVRIQRLIFVRAWMRKRRRPQMELRLHRKRSYWRLHNLTSSRCGICTALSTARERARARSRARTHHDVWLTGEKWAAAHHGQCSAGSCGNSRATRPDRRQAHSACHVAYVRAATAIATGIAPDARAPPSSSRLRASAAQLTVSGANSGVSGERQRGSGRAHAHA